MLANGTDVNVGALLRFNVTSPDGIQSNTIEHTITSEEINNGGLFDFNITFGAPAVPKVVINEFASDATPEWIELYNKEVYDISLTCWTIQDNPPSPQSLDGKTIPAKGYLELTRGIDFTFTLANTGDTIILKNGSHEVDKVAYGTYDDGNIGDNAPVPGADKSTGRSPNGVDTNNDSADFRVFDTPTPGAPNTIDTTPPEIIDHAPAGTNVPVTTNISATFNELMNASTLNAGTVLAENSTGNKVIGNITYNPATKTVTFDPVSDLEYNETYEVIITTDVQDLAGNNMSSNFTWNFTTHDEVMEATISIGNASTNTGCTTLVPITIDNAANLGSVDINLTYNSSVVIAVNVTGGDFDVTIPNLEHNRSGLVRIGAIQTEKSGLNGSVNLAWVKLKAVGNLGEISPLNISVNTLKDATNECNNISHTITNGTFTVTLSGEPTSTPTPSNGGGDGGGGGGGYVPTTPTPKPTEKLPAMEEVAASPTLAPTFTPPTATPAQTPAPTIPAAQVPVMRWFMILIAISVIIILTGYLLMKKRS